jgi:hypothetical protein
MPNYITPHLNCPHTNLVYRINHFTYNNNNLHFIHFFNPHTHEFLFSWQV